MLLANTGKTYPTIARRIVAPLPKPVTVEPEILADLGRITGGDWPALRQEYLDLDGDYLLGTCRGLVTVAYRIVGVERTTADKLRFSIEPAVELTPLIGEPQPGGPWKRGEARGTRRLTTPTYPAEFSADLYDIGTWTRRLIDAAMRILGNAAPTEQGPLSTAFLSQWSADLSVGKIRASARPDGTIVIEVPAGHDVLIRPVTEGGDASGVAHGQGQE